MKIRTEDTLILDKEDIKKAIIDYIIKYTSHDIAFANTHLDKDFKIEVNITADTSLSFKKV